MAGRGRGRGKSWSFNVEMLGFGRGESLPPPVQQPRPLFPPQIYKPAALTQSEDYDYMLALKQEFRGAARKSPFYLSINEKKKDVERYSDKYQNVHQESERKWEPDWDRFPHELKPVTKRKKVTGTKPKIKKPKVTDKDKEDIAKKLEMLEKKDKNDPKEEEDEVDGEKKEKDKKKDDDEDDEEGEGDEIVEEEEIEEETDYAQSYFDNGEAEEEEEGDEGPVY